MEINNYIFLVPIDGFLLMVVLLLQQRLPKKVTLEEIVYFNQENKQSMSKTHQALAKDRHKGKKTTKNVLDNQNSTGSTTKTGPDKNMKQKTYTNSLDLLKKPRPKKSPQVPKTKTNKQTN